MTIENKLNTGVTCTFKDAGGRINVLSSKMNVMYNNYYKGQRKGSLTKNI